jgi:hypothetical protein
MKYLTNSFSLNMVARNIKDYVVQVQNITNPKLSDYMSCIGHDEMSLILGVPFARRTIAITEHDELLVAQYIGERLPIGCTSLPEGSKIEFFIVTITEV